MSIFTSIASRIVATQSVRVDESSHGLSLLNKALNELDNRINNTKSSAVKREAAFMRAAIGDVIALAYRDWKAFTEQWECRVTFFNHVEKSNNFSFYFKEKNACPRNYEFRFTGLRGAVQ